MFNLPQPPSPHPETTPSKKLGPIWISNLFMPKLGVIKSKYQYISISAYGMAGGSFCPP